MEEEIFVSGKKKLGVRKYPDYAINHDDENDRKPELGFK